MKNKILYYERKKIMRNIKPKILAKGSFLPQHLNITVSPINLVVEPHTRKKIEKMWIEKEQIAEEKGLNFYDGTSYRLNSIEVKDNKINLDLAVIDFKTRQMLRDIPEVFKMSEYHYRKGCFSTTTLKTKDEYYLIVKLSGKSTNLNKIDLIGGIMETDIEITTGDDIFSQLYSEIEEEVFIKRNEIESCMLRAIFLGHTLNVGFYFETKTFLLAKEIQSRFDTLQKDIDINDLLILSKNEYKKILTNHNANKKLIFNLFSEI